MEDEDRELEALPAAREANVRAGDLKHDLEGTPVHVPAGAVTLEGNLAIPAGARGIVMFAHGSGSSRHSPRNRYVARVLREAGLATRLIDLLTREEEMIDEQTGQLRFDIPMLANRLVGASDWLARQADTRHLMLGYFGASTGSAAALIAAAERPESVKVVVSRGGRPDLAASALPRVQAPVLLIVGGEDFPVIEMNRNAMAQLHVEHTLEIIPGATHLFEESGALVEVAIKARGWFECYLNRPKRAAS